MSLTNNRLIFTFTRDFTINEKVRLTIGDLSSGFGVTYTFEFLNSSSAAFEVEIEPPTANPGESSAIAFAKSWSNSLTGYSLSQSVNQVTISSSTESFINIVALDSSDNPLIIPTDYDYTVNNLTTGNKITYVDKIGVTIPGDAVNQWRDVDANEVKEKHNLNDDRITANEQDISNNAADIATKANLDGGNSFTGDQLVDGLVHSKTTKTIPYVDYNDFDSLPFLADDDNSFDTVGVGGGIAFRAKRNISGAQTMYGAIDVIKESAGVSDFRGTLRFWTNNNSGVPKIFLTGDSDGNIEIPFDLSVLGLAIFDNGIQVKGVASGVITMTDINAASSRSIVYDGTTDEFTIQTDTDVQGNLQGDSIVSSSTIETGNYVVANLPTATQNMRTFVTDATATTFNSIVAGGGANYVPVFYDGTNWRIG